MLVSLFRIGKLRYDFLSSKFHHPQHPSITNTILLLLVQMTAWQQNMICVLSSALIVSNRPVPSSRPSKGVKPIAILSTKAHFIHLNQSNRKLEVKAMKKTIHLNIQLSHLYQCCSESIEIGQLWTNQKSNRIIVQLLDLSEVVLRVEMLSKHLPKYQGEMRQSQSQLDQFFQMIVVVPCIRVLRLYIDGDEEMFYIFEKVLLYLVGQFCSMGWAQQKRQLILKRHYVSQFEAIVFIQLQLQKQHLIERQESHPKGLSSNYEKKLVEILK
ncbi:hypothetical protein ABPG72_008472 [Tetrahymena utriculariae]